MTFFVKSVFARNLRDLCDTRKSISLVCRELDINRQQFARYLAGKALPGPENLRRICAYFDATEGDLFSEVENSQPGTLGARGKRIGLRFMTILRDHRPVHMPEGAYWCDFASVREPNTIIRTVVMVRHEADCTTFRRMTGHGERGGSWWSAFRGDHEGIVLERRGTYFFNGINTTGLREPSMLVAKSAKCDAFMLSGTATIMTKDGAEIVPVVISRSTKRLSLISALRQSRTFQVDDPMISMQVLDLLSMETDKLASTYAGGNAMPLVAGQSEGVGAHG